MTTEKEKITLTLVKMVRTALPEVIATGERDRAPLQIKEDKWGLHGRGAELGAGGGQWMENGTSRVDL